MRIFFVTAYFVLIRALACFRQFFFEVMDVISYQTIKRGGRIEKYFVF